MKARRWVLTATDELLTNRWRTLLSMVSVVIGIWAVTVTVAAGQMAQQAISDEVELVAGRPATLQLTLGGQLTDGYRVLSPSVRGEVESRFRHYGLTSFSAVREFRGFAAFQQIVIGTNVRGVEPSLDRVRRFDLVAGRWLRESDMTSYGPILVLNSEAVRQLRLGTPAEAIGSKVEISAGSPVSGIVIGVVEGTPGDGSDIYLPITALDHWKTPAQSGNTSFYLLHSDPASVGRVIDLLKFEAPKWAPGLSADIVRIDNADSFKTGVATLQIVLSLIAAVSLAAGGVGIINLGLVTVRERIHEFGIRRAFGATRFDLFAMVLAESLLVSVISGLVGVALAGATTILLPQLTGLFIPNPGSAQFPPSAVAVGVGLSLALGVLVGLLPAHRATRLDVISAMRG